MSALEFFDAGPDAYLLRCRSDRLAPEVQDGDWVIARPSADADVGDLVVVLDGDDGGVVARWALEGRVIGRVIGLYRRLAAPSEKTDQTMEDR